jgi:amino acid transporter
MQAALALAIIAALAVLNWFGIKPGAWVSNFFSGAKLIPLAVFVGIGLLHVDWTRLAAPPPGGRSMLQALQVGGLAGLFACTGFEYVPVPAGETKNPQRSMPIALVGSLFGATLLYALVQVVVTGTHPDLLHADPSAAKPLAESAAAFSGAGLARLISVGAVISSFGFCTGSALVGPRYVAAFAEDSAMPAVLGRRHPVHQSPAVAIAVVSVVAGLLCIVLDFDRLADISLVALFMQYIATCLAVIVLRHRRPDAPRVFRLPLGPTIPLLATLGCVLFLHGTARADVVLASWILFAGLAFRALQQFARRMVAV